MEKLPIIPHDLPSLMKDLTKLILRDKPSNIYEYAAEYFENKIRERDGHLNKNYERFSGSNSIKVLRQKSAPEVLVINSKPPKSGSKKSSKKKSIDREKKLAQKYNETLPTANLPKRISEKNLNLIGIDDVQEEQGAENDGRWLLGRAAIRIQRCYRRYKERRALKRTDSGFLDESNNLNKTDGLEDDLTQADEEEDSLLVLEKDSSKVSNNRVRSAVLIQKLIRGYVARKKFRQIKVEMAQSHQLPEQKYEEVTDFHDDSLEKAAVAIQKTYRGFHVRKEFKDKFGNTNNKNNNDGSTKEKLECEKEAEESLVEFYKLIEAATKIQKLFRGYRARKNLKKDDVPDFTKMSETQVKEFEKAAFVIQKVFKTFKSKREESLKKQESLPKFDEMDQKKLIEFERAALTIQRVFKVFKSKQVIKEIELEEANETVQKTISEIKFQREESIKNNAPDDLPDFAKLSESELSEFESAASTIQQIYKGFKVKKNLKKELPSEKEVPEKIEFDISQNQEVSSRFLEPKKPVYEKEAEESLNELFTLINAATKIQRVYRGFKVRKELKKAKKNEEQIESLPDFTNMDENEKNEFIKAATTIQNVYKGFKVRKENQPKAPEHEEELPDFTKMDQKEMNEFVKAATTIQSVYKGFKIRKTKKEDPQVEADEKAGAEATEDLPDFTKMNEKEKNEFVKAATTIQSVYKGFKERKVKAEENEEKGQEENEELPDFSKMNENDLNDFVKAATSIQSVYKGFRVRKEKLATNENEPKEEEGSTPEEKPTTVEFKEEALPDFSKMSESEKNEFVKAATSIQSVYKGFKVRKERNLAPESDSQVKTETEELPNFDKMNKNEVDEFVKAATKIQSVYKGFKVRKEKNRAVETDDIELKLEEELPDFNKMDEKQMNDFVNAATKIQSVYKGFKVRKTKKEDPEVEENDDLPDFSKMDEKEKEEFVKAATSIQSAFKGFKVRKEAAAAEVDKEDLPDFSKMNDTELNEFVKAATSIQSVYKGFRVRKEKQPKAEEIDETEELPDFSKMDKKELDEFAKAATSIQSVYKGFKVRKEKNTNKEAETNIEEPEELPDFSKMDKVEMEEFVKAATSIQSAFKGFKQRKEENINKVQDEPNEELPDFSKMSETELNEFVKAATSIQSVYKGFKVRKAKENPTEKIEDKLEETEELPDFTNMDKTEMAEFVKAATSIQSAYKGFKVRKEKKAQTENKEESLPDFSQMDANEMNDFVKAATTIQSVYKGFKVRKEKKLQNGVENLETQKEMDENTKKVQGQEAKEQIEEQKVENETLQTEKINESQEPKVEEETDEPSKNETLQREEITETAEVPKTDELITENQGIDSEATLEKANESKEIKSESQESLNERAKASKEPEIEAESHVEKSKDQMENSTSEMIKEPETQIKAFEENSKDSNTEEGQENDQQKEKQDKSINEPNSSSKDLHQSESSIESKNSTEDSNSNSTLKPAYEATLSDTEISETLIAAMEGTQREVGETNQQSTSSDSHGSITKEESVDSGMNEDSESKDRSAVESGSSRPGSGTAEEADKTTIKQDSLEEQSEAETTIEKPSPSAPEIHECPSLSVDEVDTIQVSKEVTDEKPKDDLTLLNTKHIRKPSEESVCTESIVEPSRDGDDIISVDSLMLEKTLKEEDTDLDDSLEPILDYQDESIMSSDKSNSEMTVKEMDVSHDSQQEIEIEEKEGDFKEMSVAELIQGETNDQEDKNRFKREAFSRDRQIFSNLRNEKSKETSKERKKTLVQQKSDSQEKEEKTSSEDSTQRPESQFEYRKLSEEDDQTLNRQETVEEPEFIKVTVNKTFPEIVEEVTEIESFDSATHDKSPVEEEYYKLKKKEIEGLDPEIITAIKKQKSVEEPETDEVVLGHAASIDESNLDRTVVIKKELTTQKTFSIENDEVVTGRIDVGDEKMNETYTIEAPDLDKTYTVEESKLDKTYTVEPSSSNKVNESLEENRDTLEELKNLSTVPNRRRLVSSLSVAHPPPSESYNPMYHASIYARHYMDRMHGSINLSDAGTDTAYGSDHDVDEEEEEEDQFDEFTAGNIRQKIMASSFSVADSDYFDPHATVDLDDDKNIVTALEAIKSMDSSESTVSSVDTKVPIIINNGASKVVQQSFGDAAITQSLEMQINENENEITTIQHKGKTIQIKLETRPSSDSSAATSTLGRRSSESSTSDEARPNFKSQKNSYYSLTTDKNDTSSRRLMLQREDAVQGNSTPEEDLSTKSNGSIEAEVKIEEPLKVEEIIVEGTTLTAPSRYKSKRSNPVLRQRTLPVQIDTSIMRILPRHVVKRIKSADNPKRKLFSKPPPPPSSIHPQPVQPTPPSSSKTSTINKQQPSEGNK